MFFSKFPFLRSKLGTNSIIIEDFFARVVPKFAYSQLTNTLVPYFVGDDQTIEAVAFEVYGDATLHWVVILANGIVDPYREWPLKSDVLIKQVFDKYPFIVAVTEGHGLTVGDTVQSSTNYFFTVEEVAPEEIVIKAKNGLSYLSREDVLYNTASTTRPPITVVSVSDPMETVHHYEDVATGFEVDYDVQLAALGEIVPVSNIDYEQKTNDAKRAIQLVDKRFLGNFIQMFDREIAS